MPPPNQLTDDIAEEEEFYAELAADLGLDSVDALKGTTMIRNKNLFKGNWNKGGQEESSPTTTGYNVEKIVPPRLQQANDQQIRPVMYGDHSSRAITTTRSSCHSLNSWSQLDAGQSPTMIRDRMARHTARHPIPDHLRPHRKSSTVSTTTSTSTPDSSISITSAKKSTPEQHLPLSSSTKEHEDRQNEDLASTASTTHSPISSSSSISLSASSPVSAAQNLKSVASVFDVENRLYGVAAMLSVGHDLQVQEQKSKRLWKRSTEMKGKMTKKYFMQEWNEAENGYTGKNVEWKAMNKDELCG